MKLRWLVTVAILLATSAHAQYPWEWLKDRQFAKAYLRALGPMAKERWLAELPGPASRSTTVLVGARQYVMLQSCKPHDCAERNIVLLYDRGAGVVYAKLRKETAFTWIGDPPSELREALEKLYAQTYAR